jgi:hypothetical protein
LHQLGFGHDNLAKVVGGRRGTDAVTQTHPVQCDPATQNIGPVLRARFRVRLGSRDDMDQRERRSDVNPYMAGLLEADAYFRALTPHHLTMARIAKLRLEQELAGAEKNVGRHELCPCIWDVEDLTAHATIAGIKDNQRL